ncbi:phage integrase SAM-like domain-containing protein [Dyadobacter sp. CY261]|uniref:phage integrase SAM-like domain-containing protein n=1 Tax=Dyadobacter sp. CY261 TaxID=2907203 RepID=UPI001F350ABB|nr:phage integrase SAM-like domain-containing protein [Dyadobacter sp. CY261]MCF0075412.1 phage integrase SAM-like domain-containing protein [Dyadobacter sp. CY261]
MKAEAMGIILKLHESGVLQTLSLTALKERLTKKEARDSFFWFADQCVDELIGAHRIGTARSYRGVISVLKAYRKGKDLPFRELTFDFLSKFETSHKSKGNGLNGLGVYMRTIRAIYNKAIKSGVAAKDQYPFENYKIKSAPTKKRALDADALKKL